MDRDQILCRGVPAESQGSFAPLYGVGWEVLNPRRPYASRLSFAVSVSGSEHPSSLTKTVIYLPELDIPALSKFNSKYNITPDSIFDAAWAQTLSFFTGSPDVTYEYFVSNRDLEVDGIFDIVGPVMNLLAYHLRDVSTDHNPQGLATLADKIQEQRLQDGGHTASNLREILQDDLTMDLPFNTALNFRRPLDVQTETLKVYDHLKRSRDPWHFDVLVHTLHIMDDNIVRPSIEFDARLFGEERMREVANVFWSKVQIATA
ncbi:Nonribosomal peptide synthetases (NRPS) [Penicillium cinerascens]|uniref:Nonribosomal peptide synthetases (NRPS) n=1 Tax=Penicillium cinerascens TaxID=70096 RepID=A0A9W9J7C4_9EURO|nr:Nonribosomal peptide synthetases (NRPS) [Penicillium cinerascens]KAJ5191908.1 Nonribosomal peptide synthetases (NRPS) [Penicillium cinerascens]